MQYFTMPKQNSCNLLKRCVKKRFEMFRSEIIRLTRIIAFIKQLNNLKYTQKQRPIPQDNLDVLEKLVALLPSENREESEYYNYSNLVLTGGPSNVTPEYLSELIEDLISGATRRTMLSNVRTALESIDINIFEPTLDFSDVSSSEHSNSPQQVPQLQLQDDGEEPNAKKRKSN